MKRLLKAMGIALSVMVMLAIILSGIFALAVHNPGLLLALIILVFFVAITTFIYERL